MQQSAYKKLLSALLVCCSLSVSPFCFSGAAQDGATVGISQEKTTSYPACSGTKVGSCSTYTTSDTCLSSYYVVTNDDTGIYCVWNGSSCSDGGSKCSN